MKASQKQAQDYQQLVKNHVPPRPMARNVLRAFLVGGAICVVGQLFFMWMVGKGMSDTRALTFTSAIMVAIGASLTGLGVYDEVGRYGGMGSAIPITGFANSIVSPAMEYKREGFVLGVAARMFNIAGPVIVYGLLAAAVTAAVLIALR